LFGYCQGIKLFNVPLLLGFDYFGTAYVSWVVATILLHADAYQHLCIRPVRRGLQVRGARIRRH
jgi:hypothetical protein